MALKNDCRQSTYPAQPHHQPLFFDEKYPLTGNPPPPILPSIESNALSKKIRRIVMTKRPSSQPSTIGSEQTTNVPLTTLAAIQQVVMANRILSNEGILDALGHVSVRNPENPNTFFQSRSLSPSEVTGEDILEIDLDSNVLTDTVLRPYGERIIHGALLKARPEMNAVFHGHFAAIIPFSVTNTPIRPITHVGSFLYQGVPIYDSYDPGAAMLIKTKHEGERVAEHLGQHRVQLLRGHGCNIVAENLPRLVASAIYLRENATIQWQTVLSGKKVKYLSSEEAEQAMKTVLFGVNAIERLWGYWVTRVKKSMPYMKKWK
jgi:3-hydroxy-2-methylpyridine-4,5-dicarboxylate 4-decarboxylase